MFDDLLTKDELSSGKITIGEEWVKWYNGLDDQQCYNLLEQDLHKYQNVVEVMTKVPLNHNQGVALTSFCYNVGMSAYVHSTLLKRLNNNEYNEVPHQMNRWIYAGGKESRILMNRRRREIEVWETPV